MKKEICKTCGEDKHKPIKPLILDDNPLSVASYFDEKCKECERIPCKQPPKEDEEKLENLIKGLEKEAEDDKFEEWWNGRGDEIFAFLEPQQILMVKAMASASWDASKAQILKDNPLAVLSEEDKSALEIGRDFLKFTKNFKEKFKYKQELSKREKETQP